MTAGTSRKTPENFAPRISPIATPAKTAPRASGRFRYRHSAKKNSSANAARPESIVTR
jgi:hypothetical protein